jgi:predicted DNA-binding protein
MAATAERRDTSVRVRSETHEKLAWLAEREGVPLTQYLEQLADRERRAAMLQDCNAALARLQADPERYAAYQADVGELDALAADGLDEGHDDATWSGDWESA